MNWNIELSKENTLYLPNNKNKQLILNKNITTDQQYINYKKSALIHKNIRNEIFLRCLTPGRHNITPLT